MSANVQITSHRKPRTSRVNKALRAGVTGGVMGTLALTTAAQSASAAERPAEATTAHDLAGSTAQAADSLKTAAEKYEVQQAQQQATQQALAEAEKVMKKAKAEAKRKAAAEAAHRRAAEARTEAATSRSSDRASLSIGVSVGPATGNAATLVNFLRAQVGKAYVSGATGPSAYDCSGLTQAAFKQVGVSLPRVSQDQSTAGTQVSLSALQPGDLLYWGSAGSAYHVGVYVGDGKFIGAQNPNEGVVERDLSYDQPTGAVRVL
jgi:peptidoglycan DL-endopeptidase CwlO